MAVQNPITIATYNVKHDPYPPQMAGWSEVVVPGNGSTRGQLVLDNIRRIGAEIICLQEIPEANFDALKGAMVFNGPRGLVPSQGFHGDHYGRTPGAYGRAPVAVGSKGEGVGVLFNPLRYERLGVRTPSHAEGNTERSHLWVDLRDRQTNKVIRVAAVHLFGGPDRARGDRHIAKIRADVEGGKTIMQERQEAVQAGSSYKVDAIVIAGDLNGTHLPVAMNNMQPDPRVTSCFQAGYCTDASNELTEPATGRKVDYILVKPAASSIANLVPAAPVQLAAASDHYLFASQLTLGAAVPVAVADSQDQSAMAKLTALATRVYSFVLEQKVSFGLGTVGGIIGTIFGGWMIGLGAALAAFLATHAVQWVSQPQPAVIANPQDV